MISRIFRPGFVAFDVGANIGAHSLIMGKYVGANGKVYAFEPDPQIFNRLQNNIIINRLINVEALEFGLSNTSGEFPLYSAPTDFPNQGMSSMYPRTELPFSTKIEVKVLDQVVEQKKLSRLDLIKIDTEGNDLNVLLGSEKSIKKFRPYIIFEYDRNIWSKNSFDFGTCEELFTRHNYLLYILQHSYLSKLNDEIPTFANILAVPK